VGQSDKPSRRAIGSRKGKETDGQAVIQVEEITSPELVLVSPPEIAARAREALPDYEYGQQIARAPGPTFVVAGLEEHEQKEQEPRFTARGLTFSLAAVLFCLAPLVLLILLRR
jgi:hypothetical protein